MARHIGAMKRRTLALLPFLAPLLAVAGPARADGFSAADRADLPRIEAYLNGVHTLKARFLQVSPDGGTAEGVAWLDRPGRMRFQYDPPSPLLLVAGHGLFIFHDSQLNQTTNLPLNSTPLGLLLRDNLRLAGDVTVTGIERQPGQIQVSMVRTRLAAGRQPDAGVRRQPAGAAAMDGGGRATPGNPGDAVRRRSSAAASIRGCSSYVPGVTKGSGQ